MVSHEKARRIIYTVMSRASNHFDEAGTKNHFFPSGKMAEAGSDMVYCKNRSKAENNAGGVADMRNRGGDMTRLLKKING